ncbi:TPA: recombinase family protein [Vibrio parahaemolyticus]|uniref:recombinase family protein n=1 Tax=Vibrio parahaemolyticus TaxID=670 RepID=UPI000471D154|nr:recombinase family protein [Vibrio parahaemolyticus]EJE4149833.1 recombinase family protein [Vibrio parahaemolyticus]HBC3460260.1 recombinase family protein [Vibrio parahaemolyticus]HBC3993115.1 recombinase family protein [Vibrio parahaemolyticus]
MKKLIFNYLRVSTKIQNTERQLNNVPCDRLFIDKASGKNTQRPELEALLRFIQPGDHINVHSIDRLARNLKDLRMLIDEVTAKKCSIQFHKENLLFTGEENAFQDLMLNMLGAVAEFERTIINERRLEGIAKAKEKGVRFGRKINIGRYSEINQLLDDGLSIRAVATQLQCGVSTVQRAKAYQIAHKIKKASP